MCNIPKNAKLLTDFDDDSPDYVWTADLSPESRWLIDQMDRLKPVAVYEYSGMYLLTVGESMYKLSDPAQLDTMLKMLFRKEIENRMRSDAGVMTGVWIAGTTIVKNAGRAFKPGLGESVPCDAGGVILLRGWGEFDAWEMTVTPRFEYLVAFPCKIFNTLCEDNILMAENGTPVVLGNQIALAIVNQIPAGTSEAELFEKRVPHTSFISSDVNEALSQVSQMPTLRLGDYYIPGETLETTDRELSYSLVAPLDQAFVRVPDNAMRYGMHCHVHNPCVDELLDQIADFDMAERWQYD